MPQRLERLIRDWGEIPEEECKHITLNRLWNLTSQGTSLTVFITRLKSTFKFDFRVPVTAYPVGAQNVTKQKDLDDHHP